MKKFPKSIIFTGLLLASCNLVVVQPPTAASEVPAASATSSLPTPTATLTQAVPTASATPEFAPFCELNTTDGSSSPQCWLPLAEESSTFCSDKDPYNLILIDPGFTYEVLTEGFKCSDAGKKDEKQMVTCTGPLASEFVLSVCDPSCVVPTVQAEITKCPQDYNYDSAQGCCTQEIQVLDQNCQTFKFRTTSCVISCKQYRTEARCKKNSYACEWNDQDKACELRK
jgi:hypothetical protein